MEWQVPSWFCLYQLIHVMSYQLWTCMLSKRGTEASLHCVEYLTTLFCFNCCLLVLAAPFFFLSSTSYSNFRWKGEVWWACRGERSQSTDRPQGFDACYRHQDGLCWWSIKVWVLLHSDFLALPVYEFSVTNKSSCCRSEFVFINPNSKGECGCGESFMTTGSKGSTS